MCGHCLQAEGVANGQQNSIKHQDTGAYALPNESFGGHKDQKVHKSLYIRSTYICTYMCAYDYCSSRNLSCLPIIVSMYVNM